MWSPRSLISSSVLFVYLLQKSVQGFLVLRPSSPSWLSSSRSGPTAARIIPRACDSSSRLFLEKWVAELIDSELHRQGHKSEFERDWMEKNREAVIPHLDPSTNYNLLMLDEDDMTNLRQRRKDEFLAKNDPQRYCADRCIATGNCDVFEDFLELSAREVLEFCSDCVLSESEETPCNIPEAFFDEDEPQRKTANQKLSP